MTGIYAFLAAVLFIFVSILYGKAGNASAKKAKAENKVLKTENELHKAVTPIVAESVQKQTQAQTEYEAMKKDIEQAKRNNDMDALGKIASELAQKALEMGAREAK